MNYFANIFMLCWGSGANHRGIGMRAIARARTHIITHHRLLNGEMDPLAVRIQHVLALPMVAKAIPDRRGAGEGLKGSQRPKVKSSQLTEKCLDNLPTFPPNLRS